MTIIVHYVLNWSTQYRRTFYFPKKINFSFAKRKRFQIELFHDQLPLAVPCYDLLPVTEFTVVQHTLAFGYSRFPWVDGRWVQDLRTYSPRYSWPAITSNSNFMGSSFSPQSELGQLLLRLAQSYDVATRCGRHCIMCVAQGIKGTCWSGVILAFLPAFCRESGLSFVLLKCLINHQSRFCSKSWAVSPDNL